MRQKRKNALYLELWTDDTFGRRREWRRAVGGAGEGGGGLGGGGTWESYQISMLHLPSIWGEH